MNAGVDRETQVDSASVARQISTGFFWTYLGIAIVLVSQVPYTAVVSRLLPPSAFGVVALSNVALRFAQYFVQLGMGTAIVQKQRLDKEEIRVALGTSLTLGASATILFVLIAPTLSGLLGSPRSSPVLQALAVSFLFSGLGTVSTALLRRKQRFKPLAVAETTAFVVAYPLVGIALSMLGAGVWALVAATLTQSLLLSCLTFSLERHSLMPSLNLGRARDLLAFGGKSSLVGFLEFLNGNLDTIAVGRVLGTSALGQYSRGIFLVSLPAYHVANTFTKVLFPSLSRIQTETERIGRAYVGTLAVVSLLIVSGCALIATVRRPLVTTILGSQWEPVIEILPIIAVAATFEMISYLGAVTLDALGALRARIGIQISQLGLVVALVALAIAVAPTLETLAAAWAAGHLLRQTAFIWVIKRRTGLSLWLLGRVYIEAACVGSVTCAVAYFTSHALALAAAPVQFFLSVGAAALGFCLIVVLCPGLVARRELRRIGGLRNLIRKRAQGDVDKQLSYT